MLGLGDGLGKDGALGGGGAGGWGNLSEGMDGESDHEVISIAWKFILLWIKATTRCGPLARVTLSLTDKNKLANHPIGDSCLVKYKQHKNL